jgi:hypothetical protein
MAKLPGAVTSLRCRHGLQSYSPVESCPGSLCITWGGKKLTARAVADFTERDYPGPTCLSPPEVK